MVGIHFQILAAHANKAPRECRAIATSAIPDMIIGQYAGIQYLPHRPKIDSIGTVMELQLIAIHLPTQYNCPISRNVLQLVLKAHFIIIGRDDAQKLFGTIGIGGHTGVMVMPGIVIKYQTGHMMDVGWMEFKFRGNHHMKILYSPGQKALVVQRGQGLLAIEPQKSFS